MNESSKPVYCQFLDREMAASVGFVQSRRATMLALRASMVSTESFGYASLSVLGESPGLRQAPQDTIRAILESERFRTVSDAPDADEFLESRRVLYRNDRRRYPAYFSEYSTSQKRTFWTPGVISSLGSTKYLEEFLRVEDVVAGYFGPHSRASSAQASDAMVRALNKRDGRAITMALFRRSLEPSSDRSTLIPAVRRVISAGYGSHKVASLNGIVLTRVGRLEYYDDALNSALSGMPYRLVNRFLGDLSSPHNQKIATGETAAWRELLGFLEQPNSEIVRHALWQMLEDARARNSDLSDATIEALSMKRLERIQADVRERRSWRDTVLSIADQVLRTRGSGMVLGPKRVIITYSNDREHDGILKALGVTVSDLPEPVYLKNTAYVELPPIGSSVCFLVQTEAGATAPGAAQPAIQDAIDALDPDLVVAVGIGFSLKVPAGTVMIATRVQSYERIRLGTNAVGGAEIVERGDSVPADPNLIQKLRISAKRIDVPSKFGLVLSGEKLVDFAPFREELKNRFPDAIGAEMEMAGIVSVCVRRHVRWLFFKAASDSGDGKKKTETEPDADDLAQLAGAYDAMRLLMHFMSKDPLKN